MGLTGPIVGSSNDRVRDMVPIGGDLSIKLNFMGSTPCSFNLAL